MLIIDNPKNEKNIKKLAEEFCGDAYEIAGSIQIEFDSDFSHMEMPLMNALMNAGEEVRNG